MRSTPRLASAGAVVALTLLWTGKGLAEEPPANQTNQPRVAVTVQTNAPGPASESVELGDYFLSAWLMTELAPQMAASELANQHAQREEVKQLARELTEDQRQLTARLHAAGLTAHRQAPDLGPALQVLAGRVAQRMGQPQPGSDQRVILGFRGVQSPGAEAAEDVEEAAEDAAEAPAGQPAAQEVLSELREGRQEIRDQRRDVRRERQDVQPLRRDDAERRSEARSDYREARDDLRSARDRQRDQRREVINELLAEAGPVIRQNMPMILDFIGRTIEHSSAETHGEKWIQLQQQLAQRKAESIRNELQRHQGSDFDQAFLGYQCLAQLAMVDALEVFQQHASPELRGTFDESLTTARDRLERVRQLLGGSGEQEGQQTGEDQENPADQESQS